MRWELSSSFPGRSDGTGVVIPDQFRGCMFQADDHVPIHEDGFAVLFQVIEPGLGFVGNHMVAATESQLTIVPTGFPLDTLNRCQRCHAGLLYSVTRWEAFTCSSEGR